MKRIFIGGCSRSGTTFLQELLANHSRVQTFPETGVFLRALGMRGRVLPWVHLGLTLGKERKALRRLLDEMELPPEGRPVLPPRRVLLGSSARDVVAFLDQLAQRHRKDVWVEKTPRHVLHATRILHLVPDARFIHTVRDGRDVVASIVHRAMRFPDAFPRQNDPAYGIHQWNRSLRSTWKSLKEPGHLVVLYEGLTLYPRETLESLSRALGLPFEEAMLERRERRSFVTDREGWKDRPPGAIRPARSKFRELFHEDVRKEIEKGLDMELYRKIRTRILAEPGSIWESA